MNCLYHIFIGEWKALAAHPRKVVCGVGVDSVLPLKTPNYRIMAEDSRCVDMVQPDFVNFCGRLLSAHFEKVRINLGRPIMLGQTTLNDEVPSLMPSYNFSNFPFSFVRDQKRIGGYEVNRELCPEERRKFFEWAFNTELHQILPERYIEMDFLANSLRGYRKVAELEFGRGFPKIKEVKFKEYLR